MQQGATNPARQKKHCSLLTGIIAITLATASLASNQARAVEKLTVAPTRVLFEEGVRKAKATLINTGNEEATYRISWTRKRLTEAGTYEDVVSPLENEYFSDPMIRYSPRQVVLPPGKPQVVRLLLRKPASLKDAEYRSYLRFTAVPNTADETEEESTIRLSSRTRDININLIPVMAVSIPVIVRHGKGHASVAFSDLNFVPSSASSPALLNLTIQRSGNHSSYGDFTVSFSPRRGEEMVIGHIKGVATYPPAASRPLTLPLYPPEGLNLENGKLRVMYKQQHDDGGEMLADAELVLP